MASVGHLAVAAAGGLGHFSSAPPFKKLDPVKIRQLREMHFAKHWPGLSRRTLLEMLLASDMHFKIGESDVDTSEINPLFRELLNRYWKPFVRDVYDELMVVGVAVARIVKDPGTKNPVPVVVSSASFGDRFDLYVLADPDTGGAVYQLYKNKKRNGEPLIKGTQIDKKAFILTGLSTPPALDGTIQSTVASVLPWQLFFDRAMANSMMADYNLSDPTIVTELTPDAASGISTAEQDQSMYSPGDDFLADLEGIHARDRVSGQHVRSHINGQLSAQKPWSPDEYLSGTLRKNIQNNTVSLPQGHRPANVARPERRADLTTVIDQYQTSVSAAYGVPRALLVQDTSFRTAGASDLVQQSLQQTLSTLTDTLSLILTDMFRCIYFKDHCNFVFGIMPVDAEPMTVKELFTKAARISAVSVTLPIAPMRDFASNLFLLVQGLIEWEEYAPHMRSIAGYPTTVMPRKPPGVDLTMKSWIPKPAATPASSGGGGGKDSEGNGGASVSPIAPEPPLAPFIAAATGLLTKRA